MMIRLEEIEAQLQAIQQQKINAVNNAKQAIGELEAAELALTVLITPLRQAQFHQRQIELMQLQSNCRSESPEGACLD